MTKRVTITLNDAQYRILRRRAGAMGLTDAYAVRMAVLRDLEKWQAMHPDVPKGPVEQDIDELDEEFV